MTHAVEIAAADSLGRGIGLRLAVAVIQRVTGLLRGLLFCWFLTPGELGRWELAFSFLVWAPALVSAGLPGSLSRYASYYLQTRQLREYLAQILGGTALLAAAAIALLWYWQEHVCAWLFGRVDERGMFHVLLPALAVMIIYNVLTRLFTSLRMHRAVSSMEFAQSLIFATLSISLFAGWSPKAEIAVGSFAAACLAVSMLSLCWLIPVWRTLPSGSARLAPSRLLKKVGPFAAWMWVTNLLVNGFQLSDRYMIMHLSPASADGAFELLGQYHSARVLPALLVTFMALIGSMITPHLSHDWEQGRPRRVGWQINFTLKLIALATTALGAAMLLAAPLLFDTLLDGKFSLVPSLMPVVIVGSIWFGLACIAQKYLWCAERAGLSSLAILIGLAISLLLTLLLLPTYGLIGAAIGSAMGSAAALSLTMVSCARSGLVIHASVWIAMALPCILLIGDQHQVGLITVICGLVLAGRRLLNVREKIIVSTSLRRSINYACQIARIQSFSSSSR